MSDQGEANVDGPACYRGRSTGIYKTFRPGDTMFKPDWIFIHNGLANVKANPPMNAKSLVTKTNSPAGIETHVAAPPAAGRPGA
jgi:hypothetical protein